MATKGGGNIDDLVSSICKDFLELRNFKGKCQQFLSELSVPVGYEDSTYRLHPEHPTYKHRKNLLADFIDTKKSEGFALTSSTSRQFFEELRQFSETQESDYCFSEFFYHGCPPLIDLFEQNVKLHGVVVRKSDTSLKASVLIRREGHGSLLSLTEHVIDLRNESEGGYCLKVGDIVEVTKCRRTEGVALEPEVIK